MNGYTLNTRQKNFDGTCLAGPLPVPPVYAPGQCKGPGGGAGAEAIAQTRAINRLSRSMGDGGTGVSPNLQWEVTVGRGYADILFLHPGGDLRLSAEHQARSDRSQGHVEP